MTTPERLKKRQRFIELIVGLYFIVVGGAFGAFLWADEREDDRREAADNRQDLATARVVECVADNFSDLNAALTARGNLTQADSDAIRKAFESVAGARAMGDQQGITRALQAYLKAQEEITQERKENPIPPFPEGKCDEVLK